MMDQTGSAVWTALDFPWRRQEKSAEPWFRDRVSKRIRPAPPDRVMGGLIVVPVLGPTRSRSPRVSPKKTSPGERARQLGGPFTAAGDFGMVIYQVWPPL